MFQKGGVMRWITWAAMLVLWAALLGAWAVQIGLRPRHTESANHSSAFFAKLDPPIGYKVKLPDKDVFGAPILKEESEVVDVLLITAGHCNSCAENKLHPEQIAAENFSQVILVFRSSEEDLRHHYADGRKDLRYVADIDGSITRGLNSYFTPRFYALDRRHTLRRLQSSPTAKVFDDRPTFRFASGGKNEK